MILKIIKYNKDKNLPIPADELILESDKFLMQPANDDNGNLNYMQLTNGNPEKISFWKTTINDITYIFDVAYLMNNEGKTIHKYG